MIDARFRHDRTDHDGAGPCIYCNPECAGCKAEIIAAVGGYWTLRLTTPEGHRCPPKTFCLGCVIKLSTQFGIDLSVAPEDN